MLSFIVFEIAAQAYLVATFFSFKEKLKDLQIDVDNFLNSISKKEIKEKLIKLTQDAFDNKIFGATFWYFVSILVNVIGNCFNAKFVWNISV